MSRIRRLSQTLADLSARLDARPRLVWGVVAALLTIHAALLAYAATTHSPTLNEPGHLVAGLSNWKFGRFELYRVNPPLTRVVAALPVIAAGYEEDWSGFFEGPGARPVFGMGSDFIAANGPRSIWLFTIARWACIPFSLIGGAFCFLWSRELWGSHVAGLLSLTLWCFSPNILAHAELVTPDCAATSFGLGAGYCFWRWLKRPTWGRAAAAGLMLGLAQLSKMTWVILFGLWPLMWLCWTWADRLGSVESEAMEIVPSRPPVRVRLAQLGAVLLGGFYLLNLGYGFDGTFTRLGDFVFVSGMLTGEEPGACGNRFAGTPLAALPVPLPEQYVLGVDVQRLDLEDFNRPSYLWGEWKWGGWWYYYLYGLLVKVPHGTQALALVASARAIAHAFEVRCLSGVVVLLAPTTLVFALISSQTGFSHHFRYVLPCLGSLLVFTGGSCLSGANSSGVEISSLVPPVPVSSPGRALA